jgi:tRNA(Ile)-lysidine synthase
LSDLTKGLETALSDIPNTTLGVAVSGGGDSVALLHMLAARGDGLRAVTVDHGLRDESASEAAQVAALCQHLGVPHTVLKWEGWDRSGNLQDAARQARLRLISAWATEENITHIALGHTLDDQAETVLLRLARGSGVDGLSGMAAQRVDGPLTWVRPLLHARRDELRTFLVEKDVEWIDDPSNDDPKYDRIKARQALAVLADLGITTDGLVATADRMQDARVALEAATLALADTCAEITDAGEVRLNMATFNAAPDDLRFRLLSATLQWISGTPYRPRFDSLRGVLTRIDETSGQTLHGCVIRSHSGNIIVRREVSKVERPCPIDAVWDHRWVVTEHGRDPAKTIAALGEDGLRECANWRDTGHAREVLLASPAIWNDGELVAAPLAGMANGWAIELKYGKKGLHKSLMTR